MVDRRNVPIAVTAALAAACVVLYPAFPVKLLMVAAVLVPLERRFPLRRQRPLRRGWMTDVAHTLVNELIVATALIAVLAGARPVFGSGLVAAADQPGWLQVVEALALVEVVSYWAHRAQHSIPVLWHFHALHHSTRELDWLSTGRNHPLMKCLSHSAYVIPLAMLGYSVETLGIAGTIYAAINFAEHTNARVRLPVIRWLVPNPEYHHWHHATDDDARHRNFAGIPLVDVLFGTAFMPAGRRPAGYGISDPVPETGYLAQIAYPFRRLAEGRQPAGAMPRRLAQAFSRS